MTIKQKCKKLGIETDTEKRWEKGNAHNAKSDKVGELIRELDTEGMYKFGGDGDNGENFLYFLDIFFELEDRQ